MPLKKKLQPPAHVLPTPVKTSLEPKMATGTPKRNKQATPACSQRESQNTEGAEGRADVGIKRLFLPCCIKGEFYANLTLLHKGKILCQPRLAVTARQAFMPSSLA